MLGVVPLSGITQRLLTYKLPQHSLVKSSPNVELIFDSKGAVYSGTGKVRQTGKIRDQSD